ncbi:YdeI/OmpD-associated family protein [Hymenobacter sp. BT770]|uniref:YdeI/OmpD-associated family protein n=1 Tax=Hymenobacter sp. BT770 TaxID=2886942 RepID=UPI001D11B746|nr:YdeI/OmpD-associated family protein [Hymenobacter sp. BT770]MCC3155545.1 YdeI/OmpD-associated family protein [Hymenobacter sp. BT770]
MEFRAVLQLHGKTATGVEVPAAIVEALGAGKKPKVCVTLNGHRYRSSVAVMGGVYMLGVSAEHRQHARVHAGQEVTVQLALDTEAREVNVPADLAAALTHDAPAQRFFAGLSYSQQLRHVLAVEQAKTAETRQRRIASAVQQLHEGRK